MCGIYYINSLLNDYDYLYRNKDNKRRGPDQSKITKHGNQSFFHHRLIISGDEKNGVQPIEDQDHILIFNGEIYNFRELFSKYLKNTDLTLNKGLSDTIVFFHLLRTNGGKILNQLDGFFAFIFLEKKIGKLTFGTDQIGKKPLFYKHEGEDLEISTTLSTFRKRTDLNKYEIFSMLQRGFNSPHNTIFKSVKQCEPGHVYEYIHDSNQIRHFKYPSVIKRCRINSRLISNSLQKRIAHGGKKFGFLISGGIDSTYLLLKAKELNCEFKNSAFVYININDDQNELNNVKLLQSVTDSKIEILNIDNEFIRKRHVSILASSDRPILDNSYLFTYLAYEHLRKQDCKICINGDGADEIFGTYKYFAILDLINKHFHSKIYTIFADLIFRNQLFTYTELKSIGGSQLNKNAKSYRNESFYLNRFKRLFMAKSDSCSGQNGVEARSPFADLAISPYHAKFFHLLLKPKKRLLITYIKEKLGDDFIIYPKKGFAPIRNSFSYNLVNTSEAKNIIWTSQLGFFNKCNYKTFQNNYNKISPEKKFKLYSLCLWLRENN